jgi:hypothetical protein
MLLCSIDLIWIVCVLKKRNTKGVGPRKYFFKSVKDFTMTKNLDAIESEQLLSNHSNCCWPLKWWPSFLRFKFTQSSCLPFQNFLQLIFATWGNFLEEGFPCKITEYRKYDWGEESFWKSWAKRFFCKISLNITIKLVFLMSVQNKKRLIHVHSSWEK